MGTVFAQSPNSATTGVVEKARAAFLERMKTAPASPSAIDPETLTSAAPDKVEKPSKAAPIKAALPMADAGQSLFKPDKDGKITVMVDLPSLPVAEQLMRGGVQTQALGPTLEVNSIRTALQTEHTTVLSRLAGINFELKQEYFTAYNGFAISINQADLKTVQELFGTGAVHPSRTYYAELPASVPLVGGTAVWNNLGFKGEGQVVGVVDTGVDYNHPDLGGGFGAKVIAMIDVAEHTSDAMDYNGHGTHVSGIMTAKAASVTGVNGMAPEAKLIVAKIVLGGTGSSSSEDLAAGFDWMLAQKLSGVNLVSINCSFGSPGGWRDPSDPEQIAIQNCVNNGIFVSLSAGNEYYSVYPYNQVNWYGEDPDKLSYYPADIGIVGGPSVVPGALSTAASWNSIVRYVSYKVTTPTGTARAPYTWASTTNPVSTLGGLPKNFVYVGFGNDDTYYTGLDVTGKIALILRGGTGVTDFGNKYLRAQNHGAVGAIVMNDAARGDAMLSMTMGTYPVTIPSVFTGNSYGMFLRNHAGATITFDGIVDAFPSPLVDQMVDFSSWGTDNNLFFKPEATAPGGGIWSTVPIALGSYANYSGTSMAAPHVGGAAALIKQAHPTWTPAIVKTALLNTATLLKYPGSSLYFSPRSQGAGRINVEKAVLTPVFVTDAVSGLPYAPLGDTNAGTTKTFTLKAENSGAASLTYNLSGVVQRYNSARAPLNLAGATITLPGSITLPAHGSTTFEVTVNLAGNTVYENIFVDGFILLTPTDATLPALHVPYTVFWGDWQDNRYTYDWIHNPVIDLPPDDSSGWTWFGYTWMYNAVGSTLYYLGMDFYGNFDRTAIAISPNWDGVQDNAHPLVSFMRGTPDFAYQILNSDGSLLTTAAVDNSVPKNFDRYQYWSGWYNDWIWEPTPGTVPDGSYTARLKAEIPGTFVAGSGLFETVDFPLIVDTVNPTVHSFGATPAVDGWDLNWTASDDRSGLWGYMIVLDWDFDNPIYVGSDVNSQYVSGNPSVLLFAIDNAGNLGYSGPLNLTIDLDTGWNLLSYPLVFEDNLPVQLFSDLIGSWTVLTWDPISGSYHGKDDSVLNPGVGFWLKLAIPQSYIPIGTPAANARVPLAPGSNLVGVPLMKNVNWGDVWVIPSRGAPMTMENAVSAGLVRGIALGWSGMEYYNVKYSPGYFEPLLGYWMWATTPVQLDFNYLP